MGKSSFPSGREGSSLGGSCEHRLDFSATHSGHSCFKGGGNAEVLGFGKHSLGKGERTNSAFTGPVESAYRVRAPGMGESS